MAPQDDMKNLDLPRWATLVLPKAGREKENEDVIEEEAYLRTRCFHILSKKIDHTMDQVMQSSLSSSLTSAEEFLDATSPNSHDNLRSIEEQQPSKRLRISLQHLPAGFDSELFDSASASTSQYDPLLLPVLLLNGPSVGLDRKHQVDHLMRSLRKARPRSAVVQVTNTTRTKQRDSWMASLVQQCHNLLPILDMDPLKRRVMKRKKKACAYTDMLLLWAQSVNCYDEIVVFLETDDCCYSAELLGFLHLLASRRAEHGIPLSVVMLSPHEGRRQIELRSSFHGYAGFAIRSCQLPSSEQLLEQFWPSLMFEQEFPAPFPPVVLNHIQQSLIFHQNSSCRSIAKLKQSLAHFFTVSGSFLALANSESILEEQWQRIAWFLVDERARQLLLGNDKRTKAKSCADLLGVFDEMGLRHEKALVVHAIKSRHGNKNSDNSGLLHGFSTSCANSLRGVSPKDFLESLLFVRRHIVTNPPHDERNSSKYAALLKKHLDCSSQTTLASDTEKEKHQALVDFVNELIILVGKCRDGNDLGDIEQILEKVLDSWTFHRCERNKEYTQPVEYRHDWPWVSHPPEYDWDDALGSFVAEPRKQVVAALLRGPSQLKDPTALPKVAGAMYTLIHDRVSIGQEEWYEMFWEQVILGTGSACSREKSFALFSSGLRYLKLSGLLSERLKVGSKSDILCERAKLVWCGGDN